MRRNKGRLAGDTGTATCDPGRTRTFNLTIKSRLLCQIELQGLLQRSTSGVKLYRRGRDFDKGILGHWMSSVKPG